MRRSRFSAAVTPGAVAPSSQSKEELHDEDSITQILNRQEEDPFDKVLHGQTETPVKSICQSDRRQDTFEKIRQGKGRNG